MVRTCTVILLLCSESVDVFKAVDSQGMVSWLLSKVRRDIDSVAQRWMAAAERLISRMNTTSKLTNGSLLFIKEILPKLLNAKSEVGDAWLSACLAAFFRTVPTVEIANIVHRELPKLTATHVKRYFGCIVFILITAE